MARKKKPVDPTAHDTSNEYVDKYVTSSLGRLFAEHQGTQETRSPAERASDGVLGDMMAQGMDAMRVTIPDPTAAEQEARWQRLRARLVKEGFLQDTPATTAAAEPSHLDKAIDSKDGQTR